MITVAQQSTDYGEITILRSRKTGCYLYCQDGSYQSEADGRGISLAPYIHAIHSLLTQLGARDVVMIGCAGGTLATMLSYDGVRASVVEVNPAAVALARSYFSLPDSVPCHCADGLAFLEQSDARFDAVVVDAYMGDAIPQHLVSAAFFLVAGRRLAAGGVVLVNVHLADDRDPAALAVGDAMAEAGFPVRLLDMPGVENRNAIVLGGAVAALREPRLVTPPAVSAEEMAEELSQMRFQALPAARLASG